MELMVLKYANEVGACGTLAGAVDYVRGLDEVDQRIFINHVKVIVYDTLDTMALRNAVELFQSATTLRLAFRPPNQLTASDRLVILGRAFSRIVLEMPCGPEVFAISVALNSPHLVVLHYITCPRDIDRNTIPTHYTNITLHVPQRCICGTRHRRTDFTAGTARVAVVPPNKKSSV